MNNIFITGASSGIGKALAKECAIRYKNLTLGLVGRKEQALKTLAEQLETTHNVQCVFYPVDVRDQKALQNAARDFIGKFGAPNLVIASAGVSAGTLTEHEEDIATFQAIMDINVMGLVHTFNPFIEAMKKSVNKNKTSHLVGIASVAGVRGLPGAGAYSASKAATISYLESLRVEMQAYDIQVSCVAPGYIRTPMTDINTYNMPFLMDADIFAKKCMNAIDKKRRFIIIPWQMGWVAKLMRFIPPVVWDWIMRSAPRKERAKWD